ncbi:MAG: hypothetical protein ACI86M_001200 [Saprospiraceae bacterium]|jgi:hypothetical protein
MAQRNRFLMSGYLLNTARIKLMSNWKKLTRGSYPYTYFKDKVKDQWDGKFELNYSSEYKSLTYFDYEDAKAFHEGNKSITIDLILALVYHDSRTSLESKVELLGKSDDILSLATDLNDKLSFIIDENYERFGLSGKYLSAIVQGKAASLFIRCYKKTEDKSWLELARKSLNHFDLQVKDGGIKRQLTLDMEWMEEYPSERPSMVLNGYLFWLIGLGEYCAVTNDSEYLEVFEKHLKSALNWLPVFKLNRGLLYSMYRWNHCNVHYMGIMKYQFEHLYKLTGISIFEEYAQHCDKNTNWKVFNNLIGGG